MRHIFFFNFQYSSLFRGFFIQFQFEFYYFQIWEINILTYVDLNY